MFVVIVFTLALITAVCLLFAYTLKSDWDLVCLVIALCTGLALICVCASGFRTGSASGDGISIGTIVNVGREGVWWPNPSIHLLHRGEMNAEQFAVEDDLIPIAKGYADSGARVRVHYTSSLICGAWHRSSCDVVDKIEPDLDDKHQ